MPRCSGSRYRRRRPQRTGAQVDTHVQGLDAQVPRFAVVDAAPWRTRAQGRWPGAAVRGADAHSCTHAEYQLFSTVGKLAAILGTDRRAGLRKTWPILFSLCRPPRAPDSLHIRSVSNVSTFLVFSSSPHCPQALSIRLRYSPLKDERRRLGATSSELGEGRHDPVARSKHDRSAHPTATEL
jgi:hypothetical protein